MILTTAKTRAKIKPKKAPAMVNPKVKGKRSTILGTASKTAFHEKSLPAGIHEEWRGDQMGTLMMQDSTGSGLNLGCAGYYYTTGGSGVRNTGIDGIYWSATLDSQSQGYAWTRMVIYNRSDVRRFSMLTKKGLSVRLVRDVK